MPDKVLGRRPYERGRRRTCEPLQGYGGNGLFRGIDEDRKDFPQFQEMPQGYPGF